MILSIVSCASFTEWAGSPEGNEALAQTAMILALANETPVVRNDYLLSAYYYPPLMFDHYVPPNIWRDWSALQRSLWIQSARESDLRDYEYKLQSIIDMQMFQMKLDNQSLIYDLKREIERAKDELESKKEEAEDAADELEDAAYDAKLKLEDAASWAEFRLKSAADDADFERLVAENAKAETRVLGKKGQRKMFSTEELFSEPSPLPTPSPGFILDTSGYPTPPPGFVLDKKETAAEKVLGGEIGQIIGKSEDRVEVTQDCGLRSEKKQFVSVGVDYAKRARPFVFLLEVPMPGEVVLYGSRWPPKDPINWREEKEVSRIVKNGLANAIKEIIDELEED